MGRYEVTSVVGLAGLGIIMNPASLYVVGQCSKRSVALRIYRRTDSPEGGSSWIILSALFSRPGALCG
jgi:hypothetical protein